MKMRILLVFECTFAREAIAYFLRSEGVADVVDVGNIEEAIATLRCSSDFNLVLLDYSMSGVEGIRGLSTLMDANESVRVAAISGSASFKDAREVIDAGAAGYLPKSVGAKSMVSALRLMVSGEVYVPFAIMERLRRNEPDQLSQRESEVLRGLCDGRPNKAIAFDLALSEYTIKLHVQKICRKFNARNRTHAAMIAKERGIF